MRCKLSTLESPEYIPPITLSISATPDPSTPLSPRPTRSSLYLRTPTIVQSSAKLSGSGGGKQIFPPQRRSQAINSVRPQECRILPGIRRAPRRQARWSETLFGYDFVVDYLNGSKHPTNGSSRKLNYDIPYARHVACQFPTILVEP
jgi:hypothetical protein